MIPVRALVGIAGRYADHGCQLSQDKAAVYFLAEHEAYNLESPQSELSCCRAQNECCNNPRHIEAENIAARGTQRREQGRCTQALRLPPVTQADICTSAFTACAELSIFARWSSSRSSHIQVGVQLLLELYALICADHAASTALFPGAEVTEPWQIPASCTGAVVFACKL